MSKKIQLSIPTPCHENWDKMSPVEKGKFCGSCQKQVVDFTKMSDREVAQFFKKPSTGSVCGRFMSDQLERDIEIPKKRIPWLKYFLQVALPALFFTKSFGQKPRMGLIAKQPQKDTTIHSVAGEMKILGQVTSNCIKPFIGNTNKNNQQDLDGKVPGNIIENKKTINGTVTDETGTPVSGASIFIKGSHIGTVSGADGRFSIAIKQEDVLLVSCVGFEATEKKIDLQKEIMIQVKVLTQIKGEVSVVTGRIAGHKPIDYKQMIKGKVVDEKGDAIPFASIITGKPGVGVMADESGYFTLPVTSLSSDSILYISSVGYKSIAVETKREDAIESEMIIDLKSDIVLPELVLPADTVTLASLTGVVGGLMVSRKVEKKIDLIPYRPKHISTINIFPNPVKAGNTINISFKKPQPGNYLLQLLNQSGQLIYQKETSIEKGISSFAVGLPAVAAGSYFVVLVDKKYGKKITEKIIVQ